VLERPFAGAAQAVLVLDPADDRIWYANGGACSLLGFEPAELSAIPISSIYAGQVSELDAFLARVIECGHGWTKNLSPRASSGASFPADSFALLLQRGGRPLVLVLARDRSQHRRPRREPPAAVA
jgi:PAS domain-containing protein